MFENEKGYAKNPEQKSFEGESTESQDRKSSF
jgi:hypothetical protein